MRFSPSSREKASPSRSRLLALGTFLLAASVTFAACQEAGSSHSSPHDITVTTPVTRQTPNLRFTHLGIVTTEFWVGEPGDGDNSYIANNESAWDGKWQQHYECVDDPTKRVDYRPAACIPKENPFYVALPYSDITDGGTRKPSASECPNYQIMKGQPYSWCKNSWMAIRYAGKIVYAQWEDVGPYATDDTSYVFGSAKPSNQVDLKAGLDVSPAVTDYLGLNGDNNCDWTFVPAANVPNGPWKQTVTANSGDPIN